MEEDETNYEPRENLVPTTGHSETLSKNGRRILRREIVVLTPESPERPSARRRIIDEDPSTTDDLDMQDWQTDNVDIPPPSSAQAQSRKRKNIYYQSEVRVTYISVSRSH